MMWITLSFLNSGISLDEDTSLIYIATNAIDWMKLLSDMRWYDC